MNSIFKKYGWLKYVLGGFIVALGVTVIILACLSISQLPIILNIVLASGLILFGLFMLYHVMFNETHKLFTPAFVWSALAISTGILFLVSRFAIKFTLSPYLLIYFSALTILTLGAVALIKGVFLIVYHEKTTSIVLLFTLGTIALTAGILGLCFVNKLLTASYILLGVTLVVLGIMLIVLSLIAQNKKS